MTTAIQSSIQPSQSTKIQAQEPSWKKILKVALAALATYAAVIGTGYGLSVLAGMMNPLIGVPMMLIVGLAISLTVIVAFIKYAEKVESPKIIDKG